MSVVAVVAEGVGEAHGEGERETEREGKRVREDWVGGGSDP